MLLIVLSARDMCSTLLLLPTVCFGSQFLRRVGHWKIPWCWGRLKAKGKRVAEDEMVG